MNNTVLFVGAGFSCEAGLPATGEITKRFFTRPRRSEMSPELRSKIDYSLKEYWRRVFDYKDGGLEPSLEDHFTMLDLSANAGHALGTTFTPADIRRIRRLSIHRILDILDDTYNENPSIRDFLSRFARENNNSIISTNWDIVAELHLRAAKCGHDYVVPNENAIEGTPAIPVLKLHGSANWAYCDCCRRIVAEPLEYGKQTRHAWVFLEQRDFNQDHPEDVNIRNEIRDRHLWMGLRCSQCDVPLSSRIATFSFDKALGYFQFQGVWEEALRKLIAAEQWIFIGYSLPDADFELRHMLKTAQLAGINRNNRKISVVLLNDDAAASRYRRFFGETIGEPFMQGCSAWLKSVGATPN